MVFPKALCAHLVLAVATFGCFDPEPGSELAATTGEHNASTGEPGTTGAAAETGADSSSSSSESTGDGAAQACAGYCSLITDHCEDDVAMYPGTELCETTCSFMPPGADGDELGNSVGCRTFHAILAAEDPALHCPHAGPAGDGTCGADCESFCTLALATCRDELAAFDSAEACIAACEEFPAELAYTADAPDGDSFACRLRHLTLASLQPDVHCSHIGTESPVCVD